MSATGLFLAAALSAPAPKDLVGPASYDVVHAVCISTTTAIGGGVESTFATAPAGSPDDWPTGERFTVRYLNANRPLRGVTADALVLPPFDPGQRSYWVVARAAGKPLVGVDDVERLQREVLPDPYHLVHALGDKDERGFGGQDFPRESTTAALASAVRSVVHPQAAAGQRADLVRAARESKNVCLRAYGEWLERRGK